jgi:hypothetical protein
MANMDITQRVQAERIELGYADGSRLLGVRSPRGPVTYTLLALPLLAVLTWLALTGIEHWYQWAVLAGFVATTVGLMVAVSPSRRG